MTQKMVESLPKERHFMATRLELTKKMVCMIPPTSPRRRCCSQARRKRSPCHPPGAEYLVPWYRSLFVHSARLLPLRFGSLSSGQGFAKCETGCFRSSSPLASVLHREIHRGVRACFGAGLSTAVRSIGTDQPQLHPICSQNSLSSFFD